MPFKKHLAEYLDQRERLIARAGIDVRLNTEVTPEYARALGADAIVAALGATPVKPDIPGVDGPNVLLADDAYAAPEKVGSSAVILGAGFVGTELAIYLKSLGKDVTVVEMAPSISTGGNMLHGFAVRIKMNEDGIPAHFRTKAVAIDEKGVQCEGPDGPVRYDADTVIYAVGQKSLSEEAMALFDCAPRFYPIADCVLPKNIAEATCTGFTVARDIGRY